MMDEAMRELYQEVILGHNKSPRNKRAIADAHRSLEGYNPLCGDRVTVYVRLDGDRIADVSFTGSGCAIDTAAASLMTEAVKGKTTAEVEALYADFHRLVLREGDVDLGRIGKLAAFAGVGEFASRVKCATLPWHTLRGAIKGDGKVASTE
ncbi:MAG TPA: SUF system NifU family Fe-S cluster assembly protein [Candidatus Thermoplasmatota archaeon]|nr:SUF system NifU family Fe-S cluster assembly protein [Candidatus Thermoplasmatota archaeon]